MNDLPLTLRNDLHEKRVEDDPWPLDVVGRALGVVIFEDYTTKMITFHGMVLNYTEKDQLNLSLGGESAIGKSFIALSNAALFPKEDVEPLGYVSEKAFFHDYGRIIDEHENTVLPKGEYVDGFIAEWVTENPSPERGDGLKAWRELRDDEKRRLKREWEDIDKRFLVDLAQKIMIFKDMPQTEVLIHLRSLLSHDEKDLISKIAPRGTDMEKTSTTILRGYPTVVFCSAETLEDPQEQTRFIMLSPEDTQEKLSGSLEMINMKMADDLYYQQGIDSNPLRNLLKEEIKEVKALGVCRVVFRQEDMNWLLSKFKESRPMLTPRDQRDYPHIIRIAYSRAMINMRNRNQFGCTIVGERRDLEDSLELFKKIHESVIYGVAPHVYDFYKALIKGELVEQSRKELQQRYLKKFKRPIGKEKLANFIDALCGAGLTAEIVGEDKRFKLVVDIGEGAETVESSDESKGIDDYGEASTYSIPEEGMDLFQSQSSTIEGMT